MYSYDDRSVEVVNSTYQPGLSLSATAKLFDSGLHERFSVTVPIDVPADGVTKAGAFPERAFDPASPLYFIDLVLKDQSGKILSTNFYWLSATKNVYDWSAEDNDAFTPVKSYEDLRQLSALPSVGKIDSILLIEEVAGRWQAHARLRNSSDHVALQLHLEVRADNQHAEEPPLLWDDDYFSLLPGESRDLTAPIADPGSMIHEQLIVSGWNVEPTVIPQQSVGSGPISDVPSH
jgi:exo-1,4-beta-D-glucosaminidase